MVALAEGAAPQPSHTEITAPEFTLGVRGRGYVVSLDIVPDDDNPHGQLSARDSAGELLGQVRVAPSYKLTRASATAWIASNFSQPDER